MTERTIERRHTTNKPGAFPAVEVDISVVVVNYNTAHLLQQMLDALDAAKSHLSLQIIIVDNASSDGSTAFVEASYPAIELIKNDKNVGFGRANNQALSRIRGQYVLLLNTDAFISSTSLTASIEFMKRNPDCGVLGAKLVGRDGSLQPSCRYLPTPLNLFLGRMGVSAQRSWIRMIDDLAWDHNSPRECDWVTGCYYLVRRSVIEQIGLFDPRYFLYFEEVDHCRRVKQAGWKVMYFPQAEVVHLGGESAKISGQRLNRSQQVSALQIESEILYLRKSFGLAGLALSTGLTLIIDILRTVRNMVRRNQQSVALYHLSHARSVLEILVRTKFGATPTR